MKWHGRPWILTASQITYGNRLTIINTCKLWILLPIVGLHLANDYLPGPTINSAQKERKECQFNILPPWVYDMEWRISSLIHGTIRYSSLIYKTVSLLHRSILWLETATYLFKESSGILADLNKSRNDVIQVDVTQGGMVPALPLHLV